MNNIFKYRWYRTKWKLAPFFHIVTKFPTCVNIELTNICNLKCIMCYNNFHKSKKGFMDIDLYKKIIDECAKFNIDSIKLSWRGESLIHRNFLDMLSYAKEKNIYEVILNTNWLLADKKIINDIVEFKLLDQIIISIDATEKELYEEIRKGGDYDLLIKNINELVEIKKEKKSDLPRIRLNAVRIKQNNDTIDMLYAIWSDIVDDILIDRESPSEERKDIYEDEFKKIKRKFCNQLWQRLFISWNGDVAMCCNDWEPKIVLGNVKDNSLFDIWHSKKLNNIRKIHKNNKINSIDVCSKCTNPDSCK